MEGAVAAGADVVGMARALIADPDVPRKVLASFVRWALRDSGQAPLPAGDVVWATAPVPFVMSMT